MMTSIAAPPPAYSMILSKWANYCISTWWGNRGYGTTTPTITWTVGNAFSQELAIRGAANAALAMTIPFTTGWDLAYAPTLQTARTKAAQLIVAVAQQHSINATSGQTWGYSWQSPLWAATAGMAALVGWDELIPYNTNRQHVLKMLEAEANYVVASRPPLFWCDAEGVELRPGDSAAEENSWCATVLWVAMALMPTHDDWIDWWTKANELCVTACASPHDITSVETVAGGAVSDWIAGRGYNVDINYLVTNHNRIHPDYMTAITMSSWGELCNKLVGLPVPEVASFNRDEVWQALVASPLDSSGTTAYIPTTPNVQFPVGVPNDWGNRRPHAYTFFDELVGKSFWRNIHCADAASMQARNTNHRFNVIGLTPPEFTYPEEEAYAASQIALAALANHVK